MTTIVYGMPAAPWPRHMVERFYRLNADLFAVLSSGALWAKPITGFQWQHVLPQLQRIEAVAGLEG